MPILRRMLAGLLLVAAAWLPARPSTAPAAAGGFAVVRSIPLPGPPTGEPLRGLDRHVAVPIRNGLALVDPSAATILGVSPKSEEQSTADLWVRPEGSRWRYATRPEGLVLAQRRCRGDSPERWAPRWKLRVSGGTPAAPLVHQKRVYFGATDNRVYCVKARNGHRVWAVDVAGRVTRPIVHGFVGVEGPRPDGSFGEVLLVIADDGARLLALGVAEGQILAQIRLEESEGRFAGVPLVREDGTLLVARRGYATGEAALLVLEFLSAAAQDPAVPEKDLPYNAESQSAGEPGTSGKPGKQ